MMNSFDTFEDFCLSITEQIEHEWLSYFRSIHREPMPYWEAADLVAHGYILGIKHVEGSWFGGLLHGYHENLSLNPRYRPDKRTLDRDEEKLISFYRPYKSEYFLLCQNDDTIGVEQLRIHILKQLSSEIRFCVDCCYGG